MEEQQEEQAPRDLDTGELTAVLVGRLAAPVDSDQLREVLEAQRWSAAGKVAKDWHISRFEAQWQELRATTQGIEQDRVFELVGCMSSTGERFGLALAAGNEVALWQKHREGAPAANRALEAQREIWSRPRRWCTGSSLVSGVAS